MQKNILAFKRPVFGLICILALSQQIFAQGPYYVNDASTVGDFYTFAPGNDLNSGTQWAPFGTLAHAMSVASPGDVINVDVGYYGTTSTIIISKPLDINGPNFDISPAGTGVRKGEAYFDFTGNPNADHFNISAAGVVRFKGFKLGDNLDFSSGDRYAIHITSAFSHIIQNNIFNRIATGSNGGNSYGIFTGETSNIFIDNNYFTGSNSALFNNTSWTRGIYIAGGTGTIFITNNTFLDVRSHVHIDFNTNVVISGNKFELANTGTTAISWGGNVAGNYSLGANDFLGSGTFIDLSAVDPTFRLDATPSKSNGVQFSSLPLADQFILEGKITHGTNAGKNGFVITKPGNVYVIPFSPFSANKGKIQLGINVAQVGDVVNLDNGIYFENLTINKSLSLSGQGPANSIISAPVSCTGTGVTISNTNNVNLAGIGITAFSKGIFNAGSINIQLTSLDVSSNCNYGIELADGSGSINIVNSTINNNLAAGIRTGTTDNVNGVIIAGSEVKNNGEGMDVAAAIGSLNQFDNLLVVNSNFSNNTRKGMYFEKLRNAVFDNVVMNSSGTQDTYAFNAGIDINLKYGAYENITIINSTFTNCGSTGTGATTDGPVVITIKARTDAPSYIANPASLTGVTVNNNIINGPVNGLRFGEPGTINTTLVNVLVQENDLGAPFSNKAVINYTTSIINAPCNWWGTTNGAAIAAKTTGSVGYVPYSTNGTDMSPAPGFQQAPESCTLSDAENPSNPANLYSVYTGRTLVNLDWDNSMDNVGVTGYDVYRNNVLIGSSTNSDTSVGGLSPNTTYMFKVKAHDAAGNTSSFSNEITVTTKFSGLNYRFYKGDWTALPDFNALSPVQTGNTPNVNIGVRPSGVDDDFGFVWEGYIHIPAPGSYVFETISDDGSKVYFNALYSNSNTALVNNDGLHGPIPATGTINIPVAGLYPISITYFERFSGQTMQLYWTGPGILRQLIPNSAFTGDPQMQMDNIAPGIPGNLHVVSSGSSYVNLDWDNSTDSVGVVAYDIYRNGVLTYTSLQSDIKTDGLTPNTPYQFKVKARDAAGNTSGFSNEVTGTTTNMANGLSYRYYEGNWNVLPNFNTLTPIQTGTSPNVDIGVRPAGHNDNFGFIWEGYINIPAAGSYTFETISDDGSRLYFNTFYDPNAIPTVDNDGLHPAISRTGIVNIPSAGLYPISITFFEKVSGETMQVYWTGPGISRQLIPNAAFTNASPPPPAGGLTYKYYEGDWNALPNFSALSAVQTGTTANVDIGVRPPTRNDQFAFVWEGYITIPTTGDYIFETISDDGSKLYFNSFYNSAATATVNNDGLHGPLSRTGTVTGIAAGSYPIAITFFEKFSGELMQVYWTGPGIARQLIPNSAFSQALPPVAGFDANRAVPRNLAGNAGNATASITKLYPNPFTDRINIEFYNSTSTNNINIGIYDLKGRLIYTHHASNFPAGNTMLKVNLGGQALPWGIYMVGLDINGQRAQMMKVVKSK